MKKLLKWFKKPINWKSKFPNVNHIIEESFDVGGLKYYQFADVFSLPYERALFALMIYEETRMKCTLEYLTKHVNVVRDMLRSDKIDIFKINQLNEQLNDRLHLALDVDLLYKLASVVFFDETENPILYDQAYCDKKIAHWKKHKGVTDFFLQQPLKTLIPFLENVDFNLDTYSQLNQDLNKVHSGKLSL
jgi:predicted transcriptional regulator